MSRKPSELRRGEKKRVVSERILIVCEGEKTEPNYLRELIQALGINPQSADCRIIDSSEHGAGSAPITIYRKAVAEFELDKDYDRVYCVFDRDTHTSYHEACQKIKDKKLIKYIDENDKEFLAKFKAVTSDPRFEYWLLLHFEKTTKSFKQVGDVENILKKYVPEYKKDTKGIFDKIKSLIFGTHGAIKNSQDCRKQVFSAHAVTPISFMDEMLMELIEVAKKNVADLTTEWGAANQQYVLPATIAKKRKK